MVIISKYLLKWKDKYRCMAVYDQNGEWTKDIKGNLEYDEIYISCNGKSGDQIYDYSSTKHIMIGYISSLQRGHNIIKEIYSTFENVRSLDNFTKSKNDKGEPVTPTFDWDSFISYINSLNNNKMYNIVEMDNEVEFCFHTKHLDEIATIMKANKPIGNGSPFQVRYLPAYKEKLALKREQAKELVNYKEMPNNWWNELSTNYLIPISKLKKMKINDVLEISYAKLSELTNRNIVAEATDNKYKILHWIHKEGLYETYLTLLNNDMGI